MSVSSWEPDPTGRHQYRWWDGEQWTDQVSDDGIQREDGLALTERFGPPAQASGPHPPPPPTEATGDPADDGNRKTVIVAGSQRSLASPLRRLGARLIDAVIYFIVIFIVAIVLVLGFDVDSDDSGVAYTLAIAGLGAVIGILYEVTLIATRGQTLGKMATGIVVIRSDNGALPGWGKATRRWILPAVLGFIPNPIGGLVVLVVYLSLTWGRNYQGWHDKVAGTYVVMS
ncbi:MAG: RDD family protein [Acidimicrobiia bacterium]|nr:RDD family protein [Acidimicrobiia bacterium]MYE73363.1 RDD family protein [Acidimicrobiia bacterium]MYJ63540.1 RDD family protein [Acidimicrobiia bacterium]